MSSSAIKAGKAYVELSLHDKIGKGLDSTKQRMMSFSRWAGAIGGSLTGVGTAVLTGLAGAAMHFSDVGSKIYDMSQATGVSADTLSALGHAADQSGVSLNTLGGGLKGMSKFALQVQQGGKGAAKTLDALGVSASSFLDASPEERMGLIADGLAGIEDESMRAALASKVFGKAGMDMIPMLKDGAAGLKKATDHARELGIVITPEMAARADALGDAYGDVKAQLSAVVMNIGAAVAPMFTTLLEVTSKILSVVIDFIKNNQQLIVGLAIGAAIIAAVGGALLGAAGAAIVLSAVIGGIVTAWTALLAVVGFMLSPLGLVIGLFAAVAIAVGAGIAYFLMFTHVGQAMVGALSIAFAQLWKGVKLLFGGIYDAILAGNWELAGQIAMAGLDVAFQAGIVSLRTGWEGFQRWFLNLFADMFDQALAKAEKFHSAIMATINGSRGALGLGPMEDPTGAGKAISAARAAVQGGKAGLNAGPSKELTAAMQRLTDAQNEVAKLAAEAAKQRERSGKAAAEPFKKRRDNEVKTERENIFATGSFNAAAAAMLGRMGERNIQDKIAANGERTNELLEEINEGIEEGGIPAI